ncbi:potassium-transporting ATPase subunit KdpA [Bordetella avium]|uniref:potassium-transporting ATPase subunit KdpA n=1 Tax=Bordetella avium TaxID=521 RepID=UPI000E0B78CE|nr:potassium-transporting ATPase subunit KdpA [Bordetella avium]RIQ13006.1 potassium-transporting ATPase subunit KdpA [Bordetella avium]RIQ37568.1 potassium-transporting ATPase subunit KdpA [Bordetella avium]RIQ42303.1 potassium-transporting ATPase subunit KdpA [Bordetella avium]RIQ42752.1 potassium-transporting ATPase subunit KdpA [Bordetella avium]RIQ49215.1 potassium-transporting ATPase subunit KdpA [Bordetella avium]
MDSQFFGLLVFYLAILLILAPFLGRYIRRAMEDEHYAATAWGRWLERLMYRLSGVNPAAEMTWRQYAVAVLIFSVLGFIAVYALQRLQGFLPLNPVGLGAVSPDSAFNTAISFVSNTNWQGYSPESTMSYLTQMLALTVQNFLSAAVGMSVLFALIRGFARHGCATVGNFWVDATRATLYVLLPLALALALALVSQGVIQNTAAYQEVTTLQAQSYEQARLDSTGQPMMDAAGKPLTETLVIQTQTLAMGPTASQEAIKLLGINGGGFFNANSAHPYENPTGLSNLLEMLAILIIPAALCFTFGEMVGDRRQGVAILAAMTLLFVSLAWLTQNAEQALTPALSHLSADGLLGNMEGKESRFGVAASALFAVVTTAASCGAVNTMHDSLSAMGGLGPMLLMQLGEVVFGGVGSGLYGMLAFALLGVFIAGLMIGRTPEYLGKKIEAFDMKMVSIAILVTPFLVLAGTALAVSVPQGLAGMLNPGAHGFSEVLYALSSAANNNGSAFAGLSSNTPFYNSLLGLAMWFGRFLVIVAILALAGSLAGKRRLAQSSGSMPTTGPLFIVLLIGTVLLVGALTYVPALALGPVAEHLQARP